MNETELVKRLERIEKMLSAGLSPVMDLDGCSLLTGFSKSHLYKLTAAREIPFYKKGKCLFFDRSEIENWLKAERVKTTEEIAADADRILLNHKK